ANCSPQAISACDACAEKPQLGNLGEPFINNRIGFSAICCLILSNVSITTSQHKHFQTGRYFTLLCNFWHLRSRKKSPSPPQRPDALLNTTQLHRRRLSPPL